jgi:CRISPR-associated protein Cmr2
VADTPNHFLVRLVTDDLDTAARVAAEVEGSVRKLLQDAAAIVRARLLVGGACTVRDDLWWRQIDGALEVYWAVVDDAGVASRTTAYSALAARKTLRDFAQTAEPGHKCTLCGLRQELSGLRAYADAKAWWQACLTRGQSIGLRLKLGGGERLCAICFVKRAAVAAGAFPPLGSTDGAFPSTSTVASGPWRGSVLANPLTAKALLDYIDCLELLGIEPSEAVGRSIPALSAAGPAGNALKYDGDVLYTEALDGDQLEEEHPTLDRYAIADAADQLRELYGAAKAAKLSEGKSPCKYFAVLAMDGDHMGQFFTRATDAQAHAMSAAVSAFARTTAIEIVEQHYGRAVYAGGDDLLALLPMAEALPCAEELAASFGEAVAGVDLPEHTERPGVSIGLAIAHHTSPLQAAIRAAGAAERSAKRKYHRGAVCVHVLKRSGEEVRVGTPLQTSTSRPLQVVARLSAALRASVLAGKFPTALTEEAVGLSGQAERLDPEARASRVRWIAHRHGDGSAEAEAIGLDLAAWAEHLAQVDPALGIEEVALWTGVTRFIVSGGRDDG